MNIPFLSKESAEEGKPKAPVWQPDESQQKVIAAGEGYHLVLAPPGCGKTQLLTERIRHAHAEGVDYADMLCLTFTNRAARGMSDRIDSNIGEADTTALFVGNIHRFCSRMLFHEELIPAETAIIEDDDIISIMASIMSDDELTAAQNRALRRDYMTAMQTAGFMHQIIHKHPKELRIHPECLTADDIRAMRAICKREGMAFTPETMTDFYRNTDHYRDICRSDKYDMATQQIIVPMLSKMALAWQYKKYKEQRLLVDFEDLLLLSYDALREDSELRRYSWLQVDEVQDLNPLQLAIVDLLTQSADEEHGAPTVMYLGDEQQAIFSFMGAKADTLNKLKERCEGHIHYLEKNHRSPDYLLKVFNTYAEKILHIDTALLPKATNNVGRKGDELQLLTSELIETEIIDVGAKVKQLAIDNPDETTAVIVTSNNDAELISNELNVLNLNHFKISGNDIFASPQMRLLVSHLTVMGSETNLIAWSRLLKELHVFETSTAARNFVTASLRQGIMPSDYITRPGSSYAAQFVRDIDEREVVVFDTETTGTNTFDDDIIQIAAVKMKNGEKVEGSEFCVYIMTERPIPAMLGDIPNPIIEAMQHNVVQSHRVGLSRFINYAKGCPLIAHNVDFDYNILRENLRHYMPEVDMEAHFPKYYDTLRMARLIYPQLKQHKLKSLLAILNLEGNNTHLADDDVAATVNLVAHLKEKASQLLPSQQKFLEQKRVTTRAEIFHRNYSKLYNHTRAMLYHRDAMPNDEPALVREIRYAYRSLIDDGVIARLDGIERVLKFITADVIAPTLDTELSNEGTSLIEQLAQHTMTINTLKEADLAGSKNTCDRIFVTTVHKAKGLEFDNVIVFDVVDGRYPSYLNRNILALNNEDARKLYVAISRARHRLIISRCQTFTDRNGYPRDRKLSPFVEPILNMLNA